MEVQSEAEFMISFGNFMKAISLIIPMLSWISNTKQRCRFPS